MSMHFQDLLWDNDQNYDLEYLDPEADQRNQYYNSKLLKDTPESSLIAFQIVLELENGAKNEWGFKSLKQMMKINYKLKNYEEVMTCYNQLLTYMESSVTQDYLKKSINSIIDYVSTSENMEFVQKFYDRTFGALKDPKQYSLWFEINIKFGIWLFNHNAFHKLQDILPKLRQICLTNFIQFDPKKNGQMLEIYALEVQMYMIQKNDAKLKILYEQTLKMKSAISRLMIMGVSRECGGKKHIREGQFKKAHFNFYESFKYYEEAGSLRRIISLKYLVLANMLMKSVTNPFEFSDMKAYKTKPDILPLANLLASYQRNDLLEFESVLQANRNIIMFEPIIRDNMDDLLRNMRIKAIIKMIQPYSNIHLHLIANALKIKQSEVESLLISCILENTIHGSIDKETQVLHIHVQNYKLEGYAAMCNSPEDVYPIQISLESNLP